MHQPEEWSEDAFMGERFQGSPVAWTRFVGRGTYIMTDGWLAGGTEATMARTRGHRDGIFLYLKSLNFGRSFVEMPAE